MRATIKYPSGMGFGVRALARKATALIGAGNRLKAGLHTLIASACLVSGIAAAEDHDFVAEAKVAYEAAQKAYATNSASTDAAINLARTAFDYADLAPNDSIRETIANNGIATAKTVIASNTNSVAAHYYLALNIGQLARTKMLAALKLLIDMERELNIVISLDPKFDYAGGHRTIGVLYMEAPGWPTSVGDKKKARLHLEKAVQIAPEFPDNHLCYLEGLVKWKDWKLATEKLSDYRGIEPKAKETFTGPDWAYEWHDWTRREGVILAKIQKK